MDLTTLPGRAGLTGLIPLQVVVTPDGDAAAPPAEAPDAGGPAEAAAGPRPAGAYAFQLTAEGEVLWRVLGGNHRELGRAAGPASSLEAALLEIKRLWYVAADPDGPAPERVLLRQPRGWVWRLRVDGVEVATARHPYDRRTRCHESAKAFLAVVRGLGVPAAPRVLDHRVRRAR